MGLNERFEKLMNSENEIDQELAIMILESESIPIEEKRKFLNKFISEHPKFFSEEEKLILDTWLTMSEKNKQNLQFKNFKTWISKNH